MREEFKFHFSWIKTILDLGKEKGSELFNAILDYAFEGVIRNYDDEHLNECLATVIEQIQSDDMEQDAEERVKLIDSAREE